VKARLVKFGEIEVEGKRYTHDLVIDGGKVRKRKRIEHGLDRLQRFKPLALHSGFSRKPEHNIR
jgi:hypothetical protein